MADYNPSLDFECPVCGAPPLERCALMSGNFRSASHVERNWIAKDHQPRRSISEPAPAKRLPVNNEVEAIEYWEDDGGPEEHGEHKWE